MSDPAAPTARTARTPRTPRTPRTLTVGLLQHACPVGEPPEETLVRARRLAEEAAGRGAELLVTQELFKGPYFCQVEHESGFDHAEPVPGATTAFLAGLARDLGVHVAGSLFERRAPGLCHNTFVLFDPAGEITGRYRKMHVPEDPRFYEKFYFTPGEAGGNHLGETATAPGESAQAGGFQAWPVREHRASPVLGPLVCWDQWFPEAARLTAMQGAEVLLYPTAIGAWQGEEAGTPGVQADAWHTIQRSHAIANGVFVCAANRIGVEDELTFWGGSFVVDPTGTVIAEASRDAEEALVVELDLSLIERQRRGWPFLRDRRVDAYGGLLRRWGTP